MTIDKRTKAQVVRYIRQLFRQSEQYAEIMKASIHTTAKGPRGGKRWKCKMCGEGFAAGDIIVDHIDPVTPIGTKQCDMTIDEYVNRLYCDVSNLQVLDKDCHTIKSNEERK